MNKEKALERLDALEKEAEELRKIINGPEVKTRAKEGDNFYTSELNGLCTLDRQSASNLEDDQHENGNYLLPEWPYEKIIARRNARNRLECLAYALNDGWEPDWDNGVQDKWYLSFTHYNSVVKINSIGAIDEAHIYFKSEAVARKAYDLLEDHHKEALGWV